MLQRQLNSSMFTLCVQINVNNDLKILCLREPWGQNQNQIEGGAESHLSSPDEFLFIF